MNTFTYLTWKETGSEERNTEEESCACQSNAYTSVIFSHVVILVFDDGGVDVEVIAGTMTYK